MDVKHARRLWCSAFLLLLCAGALAVPAPPIEHTLVQPDGTTFQARQWGDEWTHGWETLDGYTVLRAADGYWRYAERAEDGRLTASAQRADRGTPPAGVSRGLRPDPVHPPLRPHDGPRRDPVSGTFNLPVILITFADTEPTFSADEIADRVFGRGNRSMRDFYLENSYGAFTVDGGPAGVTGWFRASREYAYYGANNGPAGDRHAAELVFEAVRAADPGLDFAAYDNDGDCFVDVVAIVYQGTGEAESGRDDDIWPHSHSLLNAALYAHDGPGLFLTDDTAPCGRIRINSYTAQPERSYDGDPSTIGVFAHEFGHALGLPDLYDVDASSAGIGRWGLMGAGAGNAIGRVGDSPAHLCAWSKYFLGWADPVLVEGDIGSVTLPPVTEGPFVYRFGDGDPVRGGEYYLIENRQAGGFDAALPGYGLLIWHIDESQASRNRDNSRECIDGTLCPDGNYRVALVQADARWDLERNFGLGDPGDPYPGTSGNTRFDATGRPDSSWYGGMPSGVAITEILQQGDQIAAALSHAVPYEDKR